MVEKAVTLRMQLESTKVQSVTISSVNNCCINADGDKSFWGRNQDLWFDGATWNQQDIKGLCITNLDQNKSSRAALTQIF